MARINSYTKITGAPADSDCFIIDSTQGTAGTRIVLWSVLKSVLTGIFASKTISIRAAISRQQSPTPMPPPTIPSVRTSPRRM